MPGLRHAARAHDRRRGPGTVVEEAEAILAAAGLGITHVMARTLALRIAEIERMDWPATAPPPRALH
jgi:hypothetical protein